MRMSPVLIAMLMVSMDAFANRIDPSCSGPHRCSKEALPQETCNDDREDALRTGCVTRDEYNTLVHYNVCPSCNRRNQYTACCPPGCFVRGTKILVTDLQENQRKWEAIEIIVNNPDQFHVWALEVRSSLTKPMIRPFPIRSRVFGPEEFPIVFLRTTTGRELGLTAQHAVLLSSGKMVVAETLRAGDLLVLDSGQFETIETIERKTTEDDVFNLLLDVDLPMSHTIIAEGFIVGDQYWQGVLQPMLNTTLVPK